MGEGEGKLSSESFPSPSPIFFPALSYDQEVLHAREDDLRGDGGEKQAGELGKHRKAGLAEDALHMVAMSSMSVMSAEATKEGGEPMMRSVMLWADAPRTISVPMLAGPCRWGWRAGPR